MRRVSKQQVVALVDDCVCSFEFGVAAEIFGLPRPALRDPWYTFRVCAPRPGRIRMRGGVAMHVDGGLGVLRSAGTIVIPGWHDVNRSPPPNMLDALRAAHQRGARIIAICTGAFAVAAAGLLDGKRATTHWMHAERLRALYPLVRVQPDVLFTDEGDVLTSAGSSAGIDACLHVVRNDFGAYVASMVARRMVMPPQREGGQAQYVPVQHAPMLPADLAPLLEWMTSRLGEPQPVALLARRARMSPRTFARRFHEATGSTPHRWLTHQRILAARQLLETTRCSIDQIAETVGLQTAVTLRHHFALQLHVSPSTYRRRFTHSVSS